MITKKLIILFFIGLSILIFNPVKAQAAMTLIASTTAMGSVGVPSTTIDATGGDLLVLTYQSRDTEIAGFTFNTKETIKAVSRNGGDYKHTAIYYLVDPSQGSYKIATTSEAAVWKIQASVWSGSVTSTPLGATANDALQDLSIDTTVANSMLIDSMGVSNDGGELTGPDAGQTGIGAILFMSSHYGAASYKNTTSIGAYTMGWTFGNDIYASHCIAEFIGKTTTKRRIFISLDETLKSLALWVKNSLWKI